MSSATGNPAQPPPRAFVLGGARRVGRAVSLALARAGCAVDFSYNSSQAEAAATLDAVRTASRGLECATWQLPLNDPMVASAVSARIAATRQVWDIVVLCAASYHPTSVDELTARQITDAYCVNAASPAMVLRSFIPGLKLCTRSGGGSVVTLCDIHAMGESGLPRKGYLAYAMAKAAMLEMTLVMARELAPGIRVNGVAPGVVAWPERGPEADPSMQAHYLSRVPLGRAGTVDEAAEAVRWLALDATYCTGHVIRIDGGRSLT